MFKYTNLDFARYLIYLLFKVLQFGVQLKKNREKNLTRNNIGKKIFLKLDFCQSNRFNRKKKL